MLKKLTALFNPAALDRPDIIGLPENERIYAIGDIHGRSDLLRLMLGRIKADAATYTGQVTLVCIGDYIDRGPDSKGVVDLLLGDVPAEWNTVFLRGNHEQAMLDFLDNPALRGEWLAWGGVQALESYDVFPYGGRGLRDPKALAAEFEMALTAAGHTDFYSSTQLYLIAGSYLFVHAGVRRGLPLGSQMAEDLLFIRDDFLSRPHDLPYRIVFGHTILDVPLVEDDRIGLDTGAFQSGTLTAVKLDGQDATILQVTHS